MPLSDLKVRNEKPGSKSRKVYDDRGLYLLVQPNGSKLWRYKYRFARKEKALALGVYPEVSLRQARDDRDDARRLLRDGVDPNEDRRAKRKAQEAAEKGSFELVTREWFAIQEPSWVPSHASRIIRRFERDVFPYLGSRDVRSIDAPEILKVLNRIVDRGATETAHRALQTIGQVMRYAVITGRIQGDPTSALRGAHLPGIG